MSFGKLCVIINTENAVRRTSRDMNKPIYKKWWFWLIIIILVIFVPVIINEAYKTTIISDSNKYQTVWNPPHTLAY